MAEVVKRTANVNNAHHVFDKVTDAPYQTKALIWSAVAYRYHGTGGPTSSEYLPLAAGTFYEVNASGMNTIGISAQAGVLGEVAVVYY